jgi:hypothetical protein
MSFVEQLTGVAGQVQSQVDGYRAKAVEKARRRVRQAADAVSASRIPVKTLVHAGQRLNTLAHDYVGRMLVEQSRAVEGLIGDGVERLKRVAQADSTRSLIRLQRELGPASRERVARDAARMWQIIAHTGREIRALATDTYAELAYGVQTRATTPTTRRKAAAKTRRKSSRARTAH